MGSVPLLLLHTMIYDAAVATDLIITVYFPSAGENGKVSDFGPLSFLLFCFTNTFCLFFCLSVLASSPSPRAHFTNSHLNSQIQLKMSFRRKKIVPAPSSTHYLLHFAVAGIWHGGVVGGVVGGWEILLIPQTCFKAEKHAGNCKWVKTTRRQGEECPWEDGLLSVSHIN